PVTVLGPIMARWPRLGQTQSSPESRVAMPRKAKKPVMSGTVVRMMDDAWAGSCPRRTRAMGTTAPAKPAATMASTMADQHQAHRDAPQVHGEPAGQRHREAVHQPHPHLLEHHPEPVAQGDL